MHCFFYAASPPPPRHRYRCRHHHYLMVPKNPTPHRRKQPQISMTSDPDSILTHHLTAISTPLPLSSPPPTPHPQYKNPSTPQSNHPSAQIQPISNACTSLNIHGLPACSPWSLALHGRSRLYDGAGWLETLASMIAVWVCFVVRKKS